MGRFVGSSAVLLDAMAHTRGRSGAPLRPTLALCARTTLGTPAMEKPAAVSRVSKNSPARHTICLILSTQFCHNLNKLGSARIEIFFLKKKIFSFCKRRSSVKDEASSGMALRAERRARGDGGSKATHGLKRERSGGKNLL